MNKQWPKVPLGEVLKPTARVESVDAAKEYRLLGVRLDGQGPFLRETVTGTQTSATKLFRVAKDDFIYSRLFACRGAFGVISEGLNGCYVSGEFPTFVPVPSRIDVDFLRHWFRLPSVIGRVNEDCSGSTPLTRNRYKEQFFLALEIPLPPLAEQRRIVARIEELADQIHEATRIRTNAEKEQALLLVGAYRRITKNAPRQSLGDIAPLTRRPIVVDPKKHYPQIAVRSFGRGTFRKPPLIGPEVTWQKPFLVKANDILISNIKAWEGAIAVVSQDDDGRVGSHRYLTLVPKPRVATPRFVCFHLLTPEGLYQVGEASPGTADRNRTLSARTLLQIPVPLPSFEQQLWFDQVCTQMDALKRLQAETAAEFDALLPAILDRAFKGKL